MKYIRVENVTLTKGFCPSDFPPEDARHGWADPSRGVIIFDPYPCYSTDKPPHYVLQYYYIEVEKSFYCDYKTKEEAYNILEQTIEEH